MTGDYYNNGQRSPFVKEMEMVKSDCRNPERRGIHMQILELNEICCVVIEL